MTNTASKHKLDGYDPAQRAEILETESVNVEGDTLVAELTPDTGQPVLNTMPPEEDLTRLDISKEAKALQDEGERNA